MWGRSTQLPSCPVTSESDPLPPTARLLPENQPYPWPREAWPGRGGPADRAARARSPSNTAPRAKASSPIPACRHAFTQPTPSARGLLAPSCHLVPLLHGGGSAGSPRAQPMPLVQLPAPHPPPQALRSTIVFPAARQSHGGGPALLCPLPCSWHGARFAASCPFNALSNPWGGSGQCHSPMGKLRPPVGSSWGTGPRHHSPLPGQAASGAPLHPPAPRAPTRCS